MPDKEQPRSIRFPSKLWSAIDRDAVRCGRSAVKQMEVLLSAYYGLRNVELDHKRLDAMRGESVDVQEIAQDVLFSKTDKLFDKKKKQRENL